MKTAALANGNIYIIKGRKRMSIAVGFMWAGTNLALIGIGFILLDISKALNKRENINE